MFRLRFGGLAVLCSMLRESGFLGSGSWRHPETARRNCACNSLRSNIGARPVQSRQFTSSYFPVKVRHATRHQEVNNADNADRHDSGLLAGN
jgi:hypothetical protein